MEAVCFSVITQSSTLHRVEPKHKHCVDNTLTWQHLMYIMSVQLSLCLINRHAIKPYGEVEVQVHTFILALDRQEWLPSHSSHFTPSTTWIQSWEDLRGTLDLVETIKICSSARILTTVPWSCSPQPSCYNDWLNPAPFKSVVTQCTVQPFINRK